MEEKTTKALFELWSKAETISTRQKNLAGLLSLVAEYEYLFSGKTENPMVQALSSAAEMAFSIEQDIEDLKDNTRILWRVEKPLR